MAGTGCAVLIADGYGITVFSQSFGELAPIAFASEGVLTGHVIVWVALG
jgi:hypothetical protein